MKCFSSDPSFKDSALGHGMPFPTKFILYVFGMLWNLCKYFSKSELAFFTVVLAIA